MFYDLSCGDGRRSSLRCSDNVFFLGTKEENIKKPLLTLLAKAQ